MPHPFIDKINDLITNHDKTRRNIELTRRSFVTISDIPIDKRIPIDQIAEGRNLSLECIYEVVHGEKQRRKSFSKQKLQEVAKENYIPSPEETIQISYDYDLDEKGRNELLDLRNQYVKEQSNANASTTDVSQTIAPEETTKQEQPTLTVDTTNNALKYLTTMCSSRRFDRTKQCVVDGKVTQGIIRDSNAEIINLSVSCLATTLGCGHIINTLKKNKNRLIRIDDVNHLMNIIGANSGEREEFSKLLLADGFKLDHTRAEIKRGQGGNHYQKKTSHQQR